jgi:hypothetical protein
VTHLGLHRFAVNDRDIGTSLHGQSISDLIAKTSHIRVWSRSCESHLPNRRRSVGEEHTLHQAADLLAREVFGVPNVTAASERNPWEHSFLHGGRYESSS